MGLRYKEILVATLTALGIGALVFWINKPVEFPEVPRVKFSHPSGYSIMVPENFYACIMPGKFRIDSAYRIPGADCIGPEPSRTFEESLPRFPRMGYNIYPLIGAPNFPSEDDCVVYFEKNSMRRGGRVLNYVICSDGGGIGDPEYYSLGVLELNDQLYAVTEGQQEEWGVPNFKRGFKTLLTIEN